MYLRLVGLLLVSSCVCTPIFAQKNTYIGLNAASLAVSTADFRFERHVTSSLAVQAAGGFRFQQRDPGTKTFFQGLNDYVQYRNRSGFISAGLRLYESNAGRYDYPFLALDVSGIHYQDQVLLNPGSLSPEIQTAAGWTWGVNATMGFVIRLGGRFDLDLALQMGYAPPREDLIAYYYPGVGYSTFGYSVIGFKGGHIQPLLSLKYQIVKDPRQRIREMR